MAEADPTTSSSEKPSTTETLLPSREVKLTNGTRVLISPWGMKKGALVLARLDAINPHLWAKDPHTGKPVGIDPAGLLTKAWDEVVGLLELTTGVQRAEMELEPSDGGWTFEDVLNVTTATLEVCVLRADGGGALPLLVSLIGRATELVTRSVGPELARRAQTARSNGSAKAATSTAGSPTGSGSPRRTSRKSGAGRGKPTTRA